MTRGEGELAVTRVPVKIAKVLELEGAVDPTLKGNCWVYAHVSTPAMKDGQPVQYALLARAPQHGLTQLGEINPQTREFNTYEPTPAGQTFYERAGNHVIREMDVPVTQLEKLPTLDDVLAIPGLKVRREFTPQ